MNARPTGLGLSDRSVPENQPPGTRVGTFTTADRDRGDRHTYRLVAGPGAGDNGSFRIDGSALRTRSSFDHERKPSYSIRVRTSDGRGGSLEKAFQISVDNVDEGPRNAAPSDIALSDSTVSENVSAGADVGTFSTTDPGSGDTHTYSLVAGTGDTDNGAFEIDGSTLKTKAPLDHEAKPTLSIRVRTSDGRGGTREETFTITVEDRNDAPSDIALPSSDVDENEPAGTEVGTLSSADQDSGDSHTYSLVAGTGDTDNDSFRVNGSKLETDESFDFEAKSSYSVRIRSDDGNGGTIEKQFTVTINDRNDPPTDTSLSPSDVDENEPPGTEVGTFSTADPDSGDSHTYSLVAGSGDADNGSFQINGSKLETDESFDFEAKSSYSVRIRSDDGNGGTVEKQFTVTVNDVNEAPTDIALSDSTVAENEPSGTEVGTFSTDDEDAGDSHTYSLVSGSGDTDNGSFAIDGSKLETTASFNFEAKSSYTIRVRTDDGRGGTLEKQLTITVDDANDPPTDVSLSSSSVDENQPSGAPVGNFSTTDQDSGQTHTYSLVSGTGSTDNGSFQIVGGELRTNASFNFEAKSSYSIRVRTTDDGTPVAAYEEAFTITVNDINDAPVADDESFSGASRAIGNTSLAVNDSDDGAPNPSGPEKTIGGDILAGDSDEDGSGSLAVQAGTVATNDDGTVVIEADGDFTFHPKAGTSCSDNSDFFDYTVSDQNSTKPPGTPATDTGRVTIEIQDCVWYVDSSESSNGDGRSHSPLNSLTGVNGPGGAGDGDDAGQKIFLYDGSYSGGLPLENTQTLLSERHGLSVPDGGSGSVTLVPAGGSNTTIAGGLTLAQNNTVQGVHLGTNASGAALSGTSVGTATINTATSGAIDNTSGKAVDISNGTVNAAFTGVSSTNSPTDGVRLDNVAGTFDATGGSLQNATDQDVDISGNNSADTVSFSYDGTITDDTGALVNVSGQSGGTKDFNGAITDGNDGDGAGISLANNMGATVRFDGGLTLSTGASNAFSTAGGGTLVVTDPAGATDNSIATTTGTALNVANTNIGSNGLTFRSISAGSSTSGPTNGIVLNGTGSSGGLTVQGNGGACNSRSATCTGGTMQKTSGDGISLTNTLSPSFAQLKILDTGRNGVEGTEVTNFRFTDGTIDNSGTASGVDDSNIAFNNSSTFRENNVDGTVTITGNVLSNPHYNGVDIFNWAGVLDNANVSNNTLTAKSGGPHSLGSGIRLIARGENVTSARVTRANLDNNTVRNGWQAVGIQAQGGHVGSAPAVTFGVAGSATDVISISGNTLSATAADPINAEGIVALHNHAGQANFRINNNGTAGTPIGNTKGTAISNSAFGDVTVTSEVKGNHIAPNNIFASQGIGVGTSSSISPSSGGNTQTTDFTVAVEDNVISQTDGAGILAVAGDAAGLMKIAIKNNDVAGPLTSGRQGIVVRAGNSNGDNDVCLDIAGNKSAAPPSAPQFLGIGLRKQGTSPTVNAFGVEGMTATSSPGVENHVDGQNPNGGGTLLVSATSGFSSCSSAP